MIVEIKKCPDCGNTPSKFPFRVRLRGRKIEIVCCKCKYTGKPCQFARYYRSHQIHRKD